jgi:DNA-directed RNA polymerase specialized sigma24 family protein
MVPVGVSAARKARSPIGTRSRQIGSQLEKSFARDRILRIASNRAGTRIAKPRLSESYTCLAPKTDRSVGRQVTAGTRFCILRCGSLLAREFQSPANVVIQDGLRAESSVSVVTEEVFREERILTQVVFSRLLEWLDDGVDSQGETYLEMRRRLVSYFDRRNRPAADELADETLNRIARTLEQSGVIATRPPARYCYVIARFVLLEDLRRERRHVPLDEPRTIEASRGRRLGIVELDLASSIREHRLECLDRCLDELKPAQRELIVEYYQDSRRQKIDRRRNLAARLGISMNALGIRVCRLRDDLMTCVEGCRKDQRRI